MNKKIKIVIYVILCFAIFSVIAYGRYETRDEETKAMYRRVVNYGVVNTIAKNATFNKHLSDKKINLQKDAELSKNPEKKIHAYNNVVEFLDFEEMTEEVDGQTLFDLGESYLGFARSYPEDTTFFKADFSTFFNAKKGDEVSIVIGDNQYLGVIDFVNNQDSSELDLRPEDAVEGKSYHFIIRPYNEIENNISRHNISIGGIKLKDGFFSYEGYIHYEGMEDLRFKINDKVGVLVPADKFGDYLSIDLGSGID